MDRTKERKRRMKRADALWSEAVKIRDGHRCKRCGSEAGERRLNSCHFHGKAAKTVRWDIKNGVTLCGYPCHMEWAHKQIGEFYEAFEKWYGKRTVNYLRKKKQAVFTPTLLNLEGIINDLTKWIKENKGKDHDRANGPF